jgi:putative chitobiose transport system permease protein
MKSMVALERLREAYKRRKLTLRRTTTAWMFLALPMLFLVVFFFVPMIGTASLSLTNATSVGSPRVFTGLQNYDKLLHDARFWADLRRTFIYTAGVVPSLVVFPFLLALLVNRQIRGVRFFQAAYYVPVITSMVIVSITWTMLYNKRGLLNYILFALGIKGFQPAWLADAKLALPAIMLVTIWQACGWYMVIYIAGLKSISRELYEAAMIDGASGWQLTRFITIPLIRPYATVVAVWALIGSLKVFDEVYVMTMGGPAGATEVVNFYIYNLGFRYVKMGYAAAVSVALLIIILFLTAITLRVFEREM